MSSASCLDDFCAVPVLGLRARTGTSCGAVPKLGLREPAWRLAVVGAGVSSIDGLPTKTGAPFDGRLTWIRMHPRWAAYTGANVPLSNQAGASGIH